MRLRFGPLALRLHGSRRWLDLARQRYDGFIEGPAAGAGGKIGEEIGEEIRVDYEDDGQGPPPRDPENSHLGPLEMARRSGVWHLTAADVSGTFDGRHLGLCGPLATYPLDSALIALWTLATDQNVAVVASAVVHGALLADGDHGWLCTGPSGVGKSTLAGLLPQRALCDELVGVRIADTARGPALFAFGLPFWRGRPGRVHLAGVHRLRHGDENLRRSLTTAEAFAQLRSQILWPSWSETALPGAFRIAAALAELPCHDLAFRPDPGVWHHLASPAPERPVEARTT